MSVIRTSFGTTADGQAVELLTIRCGASEVEILTFGATIRSLRIPDQTGKTVDVVLGYDCIAGYEKNGGYLGALVGRYANRIAKAHCIIDGNLIPLQANEREKQLHGGTDGFSFRIFDAEIIDDNTVCLSYTSPDGEGGFPGTLTLHATYTLTEHALTLRYEAESDKTTYCNITNHSYFNLNGGGNVLDHKLWINAHQFTPVNADSIPTAMATNVVNTAFDFTVEKDIGRDIDADEAQLHLTSGYDHNFVLDPAQGLRLAARLTGDKSGIVMETWTEKPGVQLYTANFLDTDGNAKGCTPYQKRQAVCLETQFFPDSPNHPEWGDILLRSGQRYDYTTEYRFRTVVSC
ncbi:MAG: galactose mutarotase [Oscillospiraceae bacterium]|nr:galactose mutarotase [Oscillospiraceae bacterium]